MGGPSDNSQQKRLLPSFREWLPPSHELQRHQEKGWVGSAHRPLGSPGTGNTPAGPTLTSPRASTYRVKVRLLTSQGLKSAIVVRPCLPGSSVHGIFQASTLEWVAVSFSGGVF